MLNDKQEEVLSLKEKVEVLKAQVRSCQESRDHLAANLQLAEEVIELCDHVTSHEICLIRKRSSCRNSYKWQNLPIIMKRAQFIISKFILVAI